MVILVDSYDSGYDTDVPINAVRTGVGQSFTSVNISVLNSCKFYLKKVSTPTGSAYAKLYTHLGTYGNSSVPTGAALAISDAFDVSTLDTTYNLITFNFTGINKISLSASTYYIITIEYTGTSSNYLHIQRDGSVPSHLGNECDYVVGSWSSAAADILFFVYADDLIPVANFSGTPTSGISPLSVVFTDASTNTPTSWLWEKNDGSGYANFSGTPTAQNPTESFITGLWDVKLTATNAGGSDPEEKLDYINVSAPYVPPIIPEPPHITASESGLKRKDNLGHRIFLNAFGHRI